MSYQRINCEYRIDERGREKKRERRREKKKENGTKGREVYREGKRGRAVDIEGKSLSYFHSQQRSNSSPILAPTISLVPPSS